MHVYEKRFSVLMSLYHKESPVFFSECIESLFSQSVLPAELVLVVDGPIGEDLEKALAECCQRSPFEFRVVRLPENRGLGEALAVGVEACEHELIARMDTDDIARSDRFALQLAEFEADPDLGLCGSHIVEFEGDVANIVARRVVPLTEVEIRRYQKKRDAFNHVSVMFKKSEVLKAGNYKSALLMEDSLLWANMLMNNVRCKNIDDYLVYVRIGGGFYERRGGWSYFKKYRSGRKQIWKTGYISAFDYISTVAIQLCVACMPQKARAFVFKKMLHR